MMMIFKGRGKGKARNLGEKPRLRVDGEENAVSSHAGSEALSEPLDTDHIREDGHEPSSTPRAKARAR